MQINQMSSGNSIMSGQANEIDYLSPAESQSETFWTLGINYRPETILISP